MDKPNSGITLIENAFVITGERRRHDKDFVKIYKLFSQKCLEDFGSMNGELKLLVYIMGQMQESPMNSEGWIFLKTSVLLEHLKVGRSTYFKYLKQLKDLGYVQQFTNNTSMWRINPDFCYRGDLVESKRKGKLKALPPTKPSTQPQPKPPESEDDLADLFG